MIASKWFFKNMACPDCGNQLSKQKTVTCKACDYEKQLDEIDFRPNTPSPLNIEFTRLMKNDPSSNLENLGTAPPEITYKGPTPIRDSRQLLSEISSFLHSGDAVLDLGCGPKDQVGPISYLGYQYVGVDYSNPNADLLADAHAIPFQDSSFHCVLSYAVLEHLHNPFVAIREIERVLKPGGIYVGTVSLGEPFHDSYFHHTAWGFISLIASTSGFKLLRLWPSSDTLYSLAMMGRYPKVIRTLILALHFLHSNLPFLAPRKMQWADKDKRLDQLHRAGGICFTVQKIK